MDEKPNINKPLRTSSNMAKDLYETYLKNEEKATQPNIQDEEKIKTTDVEAVEEAEAKASENEITLDRDTVADLIKNYEKAINEREEYKEHAKRLAAELENFRKRALKEKQEMIDYANERLLFKLLTILDDLDSAIEAGKQNTDYEALFKGIEMIHSKLLRIFEEAGVKRMDSAEGEPFNVEFHEAVMHIPSDYPEGYVVKEVQPGYFIHNKVLRHSKVVTSAGKDGANQNNKEKE